MASLRQIRRRVKSIESIHEITKAMEMIAAFRLKKAENRFLKARAFFSKMEKLVMNLVASQESLSHPLFETRVLKKKALVVLTGDKGLCGSYNANLLKAAMAWRAENKGFETFLVPVGKVGAEVFRKRGVGLLASYPEKSSADPALSSTISSGLEKAFLSRRVDSVELLYASFRSGASGVISFTPFLGLSHLWESRKRTQAPDYIYEPDFEGVFSPLLTKYLEGRMRVALLESLTSETSARMIAMKQATENGEEVLDLLRLLRNKTRQATITRELSEIVSGASILV